MFEPRQLFMDLQCSDALMSGMVNDDRFKSFHGLSLVMIIDCWLLGCLGLELIRGLGEEHHGLDAQFHGLVLHEPMEGLGFSKVLMLSTSSTSRRSPVSTSNQQLTRPFAFVSTCFFPNSLQLRSLN